MGRLRLKDKKRNNCEMEERLIYIHFENAESWPHEESQMKMTPKTTKKEENRVNKEFPTNPN